MEERIQKIETELAAIRERNMRVEADKAWETSVFRMISLAVVIYIVAAAVMYLIAVPNYLTGAFVPTAGFILSVQSLPIVKRWWIKQRAK